MDLPPFSLGKVEKTKLYEDALFELTRHHWERCPEYQRILNVLDFDPAVKNSPLLIPFIPVRLFKDHDLLSVDKADVVNTVTSSGTSGQAVSRIFLDRSTAISQTRALSRIVSAFTGPKRLPMLIIDSRSAMSDRNLLSARGAGIIGFSKLGHDVTFALDDEMRLDVDRVESFSAKHRDAEIFLFGFTYLVWEYFCQALVTSGRQLDLGQAILFHGGGWKNLTDRSVDNRTFKKSIYSACGIKRVHNYYGMVEQTGSIFVECEMGFLHASIFSDIIIRRPDFSVCGNNEAGIVQLVSLLPSSYPGHSILTEDTGEIVGEDDCHCGRLGKYFRVHGRISDAELRGCSDVYASVS